ncbi:MAG: hypothetical protein K6F37_09325 [Lachnospiraceae bacterium]|nr:hypothetical protein [Lachnospiraceae bacterium]
MSRHLKNEEYEKTFSGKFRQWLNGESDPFLGKVEQKSQKEQRESRKQARKRRQEHETLLTEAYNLPKSRTFKLFGKAYGLASVLFAMVLIVVLVMAVSYLPTFGEADKPINNEVSERYIEKGLEETGAVNIVTGMILDYRAFDTLGESHVLFLATIAVLVLLRVDDDSPGHEILMEQAADRFHEPKNDIILQTAAKFLVPIIFIFGIYVILCGHLGPGGGFSGGAIIGAGLILYLTAFGFNKTERFFTAKTQKIMSVSALGCYSLCKSYSFYTGANHIESIIPLGIPGTILSSGLILILNICVGVVVSATMYTFYVMFRKGNF